MIKVYGIHDCHDCIDVHAQIEGKDFEYIDIGTSVKLLKEFLRLRDTSPVFEKAKQSGSIGIPCFVKEDGTITLDPTEVGLKAPEIAVGQACGLDGKGC